MNQVANADRLVFAGVCWRGLLCVVAVSGAVFSSSRLMAFDERHPLESVDLSSPRSTLTDFIDSCQAAYRFALSRGRGTGDEAERAALTDSVVRCLDLSQEPEYLRLSVGASAAVCLKEVFDRIDLPPDHEIPGDEEIEQSLLTRWRVPHTEITIVRLTEGPRMGEYVFSADTVARAVDFYSRVRHLPYKTTDKPDVTQDEVATVTEGFLDWYLSEPGSPWLASLVHKLPNWMDTRYYGQAVWQWIGLLITLVVSALLMFAAYRMGHWRSQTTEGGGVFRYTVTLLFPLAALLVPVLARSFTVYQLAITGTTLVVMNFTANVVFLLAAIVLILWIGNRVAEALISSPRIHPKGIDAQFIRIICRVLSIVAAVIVFLEGGQYLGIPLTTLLAGAGVGGLAVALAAQDTLRSLFGSVTILLDKPYRVGERVLVKGYDGVVEEIGLRSTKLRLLTGHQAAIPNEEMARSDIENIGRRPHIRRTENIALPFDLPPQKVERALEIVREQLKDHEGMQADWPPRVYFNEFNRDSVNLRIIYWYHPAEYWQFLTFSERLNLNIMREFEAEGIPFALPSTKTFMTSDKPGVERSESSADKLVEPI